MLRCGTENETCTFSRLPKVPRQALSRMLPTSVITSRADASIDSGSAGSLVSSSFSIDAPASSRISSASPATGPEKIWCTLATCP